MIKCRMCIYAEECSYGFDEFDSDCWLKCNHKDSPINTLNKHLHLDLNDYFYSESGLEFLNMCDTFKQGSNNLDIFKDD